MKTFIVSYIYRGSENRFMSPFTIKITSRTKKEARENAFYQLGDIYKITAIAEI